MDLVRILISRRTDLALTAWIWQRSWWKAYMSTLTTCQLVKECLIPLATISADYRQRSRKPRLRMLPSSGRDRGSLPHSLWEYHRISALKISGLAWPKIPPWANSHLSLRSRCLLYVSLSIFLFSSYFPYPPVLYSSARCRKRYWPGQDPKCPKVPGYLPLTAHDTFLFLLFFPADLAHPCERSPPFRGRSASIQAFRLRW